MKWLIKKIISKISPNHFKLLAQFIEVCLSTTSSKVVRILDIGGGAGEYWASDQKLKHYLESQKIEVLIMDAQIPELKVSHNIRFVSGLAPSALIDFENDSFDLVVAFDVIEHLKKEDGYLLLYHMERIAKTASLIFTPNGFLYQQPDPGNQFNAHISGWKPHELKKFGWDKVYGHGGLRQFFGVYGLPKRDFSIHLFHNIWILLLLLSQIIVFKIPRLSFSFSAVKLKRTNRPRVVLSRINRIEE